MGIKEKLKEIEKIYGNIRQTTVVIGNIPPKDISLFFLKFFLNMAKKQELIIVFLLDNPKSYQANFIPIDDTTIDNEVIKIARKSYIVCLALNEDIPALVHKLTTGNFLPKAESENIITMH